MVHVIGDDKGSGGNPYNLPKVDHGEEGSEKHRWYMGNTVSQKGVEGSCNFYRSQIHQLQVVYVGTMGGFNTNT